MNVNPKKQQELTDIFRDLDRHHQKYLSDYGVVKTKFKFNQKENN